MAALGIIAAQRVGAARRYCGRTIWCWRLLFWDQRGRRPIGLVMISAFGAATSSPMGGRLLTTPLFLPIRCVSSFWPQAPLGCFETV